MTRPFTTRPELRGTFGMVTSTHWLASQAGMAALEAGGNAFDAAAATAFVLQVVEPHLNGPGGEVPIIGWDGGDSPFVVCGQGCSPAAATIERFEELGVDLVPGTGLLPACVPGAFGAWLLLLKRWGTMRLRDVLGYAIGYAEHGFPLIPQASQAIGLMADVFSRYWPTSLEVWLPGGRVPEAYSLFRNPQLAATYIHIVEESEAATSDRDGQLDAAHDLFYRGFVAETIAQFCTATAVMDVTGDPHSGLLTYEDLARWQPSVERPVSVEYAGRSVYKAGPWSQAPVFLQQLRLLEGFDLASMGPASPELVHTVVECAKLAFADREAFYGDPRFVDVPLDDLLSPAYANERRKLVGDHADTELRPGCPGGRTPTLPVYPEPGSHPSSLAQHVAGTVERPTAAGRARGDTCHLDVMDRFGNVVTATPSGGWLQSSPTVPGLGFPLDSRGEMFWLKPGLAGSLAPGKRPRTTLSPTMVLRDGRPEMAFGTPGGDQQDQWTLLLFLHAVHHGMNLQEAIEAPKWHSQHFPSSFYPRDSAPGRLHVEIRAGDQTVAALRSRGHDVVVDGPWSLGYLCAVGTGDDAMLRAAASPRGSQCYAVGR